jgi:toxin CcdB
MVDPLMARFDVHRYASASTPLVLDVQADLLSNLATRVVIPLAPEAIHASEATPRLKPVVEVDGSRYVVMTTDIGTLKSAELGEVVGNLEKRYRAEIVAAIDFVLQGF